VVSLHTRGKEVILEDMKQKEGLSTSPRPSNDFGHTIADGGLQLV